MLSLIKVGRKMERQRSLSFKSTRLLVFSFTFSSFLLFLSFFSIWVLKDSHSIPLEINLQLNKSSPSFGLKPKNVQTSTGFSRNFSVSDVKNSILIDTHFRKPENSSGNALVRVVGKVGREESVPEGSNGRNKSKAEESTRNAVVRVVEKVERKVSTPEHSNGRNKSEAEEGFLRSTLHRKSDNSSGNIDVSSGEIIQKTKRSDCDVSIGRWVFDESYPLYENSSCPFIDEGFSCESNGRKDRDYMKWRWQPYDCNIPRFDAVKMLELIRGKRLVFVGDSINRNQWESMLCLLRGAIADPRRVYETHGRRITKEKGNYSFKFVDYKCTVEYYVTHFLVHESKARVGQKRRPTLRIDAVDRSSSRWKGADILVFNTAHWWSHYKTKAGVNYYQEGDQVHPQLDVATAFRRALMTWASWVDKHVNPSKTKVFFRSSSPSHFRGGQWNSGGHCKEAMRPLNDTAYVNHPEKNTIVEEIIKQMRTPVTFLNVTALSKYRIDGHPSIYGRNPGKGSPSNIQDCSHWCLPGIPDTWNELLYFYLQSKKENSSTE